MVYIFRAEPEREPEPEHPLKASVLTLEGVIDHLARIPIEPIRGFQRVFQCPMAASFSRTLHPLS